MCYYYDRCIAGVDYGEDHVMVPRRVDMAHALIRSYGLLGNRARLRTRPATDAEISAFHDGRYVGLLRDLTPEAFGAGGEVARRARGCNVGAVSTDGRSVDNPPVAGLWDYCQRYAGGSLAAARALASGEADVAINWSGGMHHACRDKASGFCYVNDIVLAIEELLGHFRRVLYVDIDVHHGDGVETAFRRSNRVMTVSFHQRTEGFFPSDRGHGGVPAGGHRYTVRRRLALRRQAWPPEPVHRRPRPVRPLHAEFQQAAAAPRRRRVHRQPCRRMLVLRGTYILRSATNMRNFRNQK